MRVLRQKKRTTPHRGMVDVGFSLALLVAGVAVTLYGVAQGNALLTWFPLVGIALGVSQLFYWLRPPQDRMHWWYEHLTGMLSCSISTITAFTVFGAPRLLGMEVAPLWLWFAPTVLLAPVITGFNVYYRLKFQRKKRADDK